MKNNIQQIVYIPFTGVGLSDGFRGQKWLNYRIKIFKEFTLKSLLNQSQKDFILWLSFRPEEKHNKSVIKLFNYLEDKIKAIFTFDNLMYYDDKIQDEKVILKNQTLLERLSNSLKIVRRFVSDDLEHICLSRVDSDDMLHRDFLGHIRNFRLNKEGLIICKNGYTYNSKTKQLAQWNPKTNPPFHTLVFKPQTFFDPQKHYEFIKGYTTHEDAPLLWPILNILLDGYYCVIIHNSHISTNWDHPFRGIMINDDKVKNILQNFGIC